MKITNEKLIGLLFPIYIIWMGIESIIDERVGNNFISNYLESNEQD